MNTYSCNQCNEPFKASKSKKRKYCSRKCSALGLKEFHKVKMQERWASGEFDKTDWASFISKEDRKRRSKSMILFNHSMCGEKHPKWKGGMFLKDGHIYNWLEKDYQHRVIAKTILKRDLLVGEVVHHIDEDMLNNNPINLIVINNKLHMKYHKTKDKLVLANFQNLYEVLCDQNKDH